MRAFSVLWRAVPFSFVLFGCGSDANAPSSIPQPESPGPAAASIVIVSGKNQEATVGEYLREPLVVQVLDAQGAGMPGVALTWEVTGPGWAGSLSIDASSGRPYKYTDEQGFASARFFPRAFGLSAVTVRAVGSPRAVTFMIDPSALSVWYGIDLAGPLTFEPFSCDVACAARVPVGAAVEWVSGWWGDNKPEWTVTSIAVPPGGASFSSGVLHENDRFRFVPRAIGTWTYVDQIYGAKGTLIAY